MGAARTDVVAFAGRALAAEGGVGANYVAHVGEVAFGLEVAYFEHGRLQPFFDADDLPGEAGDDELLALAGADVVEGAGHHDLHSVGFGIERAKAFLGHLADGVGVCGI